MARHVVVLLFAFAALAAGQNCISPYDAVGGSCIFVDSFVSGSMVQMRSHCKALSGDLIWFDSNTDCGLYTALLEHFQENNMNEDNYWMGVSDEDDDGVWRYLKTNEVARPGPPFWAPGKPTTGSLHCAIFSKGNKYYWIDVNCASDYAPICRFIG